MDPTTRALHGDPAGEGDRGTEGADRPAPDPVLETRLVSPTSPPAPASVEVRFTVGGVISKTMSVWWTHVAAFTAISLGVYAPLAGLMYVFFRLVARFAASYTPDAAPAAGDVEALARLGAGVLGVAALTVVLQVIQVGAVTYGTVRRLHGERARLGGMISIGVRRGLPVVASGFLLWLGMVLGTVLLVVPGIMFAVAAAVAIPAAVVERPGVVGALRRSFALTRGERWPLFGALLALFGIVWVVAIVFQMAASTVATLVWGPGEGVVALGATVLVTQIGNAVFSSIPLVGIAVAYHDLRRAKEGVDTAELARVFE